MNNILAALIAGLGAAGAFAQASAPAATPAKPAAPAVAATPAAPAAKAEAKAEAKPAKMTKEEKAAAKAAKKEKAAADKKAKAEAAAAKKAEAAAAKKAKAEAKKSFLVTSVKNARRVRAFFMRVVYAGESTHAWSLYVFQLQYRLISQSIQAPCLVAGCCGPSRTPRCFGPEWPPNQSTACQAFGRHAPD